MTKEQIKEFNQGVIKTYEMGKNEILSELSKLVRGYGRSNLIHKNEIEEFINKFKEQNVKRI